MAFKIVTTSLCVTWYTAASLLSVTLHTTGLCNFSSLRFHRRTTWDLEFRHRSLNTVYGGCEWDHRATWCWSSHSCYEAHVCSTCVAAMCERVCCVYMSFQDWLPTFRKHSPWGYLTRKLLLSFCQRLLFALYVSNRRSHPSQTELDAFELANFENKLLTC